MALFQHVYAPWLLEMYVELVMGTIIETKCKCGEPINIEIDCEWARTCRTDLIRPFYPDTSHAAYSTQFRCRSCGKPVNETVPEAAYGERKVENTQV